MHIGSAIKSIRERQGLKQKDLAARLKGLKDEYDPGNLSRIEKGKMGYSVEFLNQLPGALGVPLSAIFSEAEGNKDNDKGEPRAAPVYLPLESYRRLAKLVALWALLTDASQEDVIKHAEELTEAAQRYSVPPKVKLRSKRPRRARIKRDQNTG